MNKAELQDALNQRIREVGWLTTTVAIREEELRVLRAKSERQTMQLEVFRAETRMQMLTIVDLRTHLEELGAR